MQYWPYPLEPVLATITFPINKVKSAAAETVLGYFGFDRSIYGNKKNIGPRKWTWLLELRQERKNDIRTEVI
jgi:hypothetical protein